jgi:hypothetical protein
MTEIRCVRVDPPPKPSRKETILEMMSLSEGYSQQQRALMIEHAVAAWEADTPAPTYRIELSAEDFDALLIESAREMPRPPVAAVVSRLLRAVSDLGPDLPSLDPEVERYCHRCRKPIEPGTYHDPIPSEHGRISRSCATVAIPRPEPERCGKHTYPPYWPVGCVRPKDHPPLDVASSVGCSKVWCPEDGPEPSAAEPHTVTVQAWDSDDQPLKTRLTPLVEGDRTVTIPLDALPLGTTKIAVKVGK